MTTLANLVDQVRTDVLHDTGTSQRYSDYAIAVFINNGLRLSWPLMYTPVTDTTLYTSKTSGISDYTNREYTLPAGIPIDSGRSVIRKVEVGPIGGQRISDSKQYTDRYRTHRGWMVDYSRGKLIFGQDPDYDYGLVYQNIIRIAYVRPITQFTLPANRTTALTAQTYTGPENLIPALLDYAQYQAMLFREPSALTNQERLQNVGQVAKQAEEHMTMIMRNYGLRMTWPRLYQ